MYRLNSNNEIQRIEDGTFIPADEMNGDYRQYLAWYNETPENRPEPYVAPPPPIPDTVTMRQARLALLASGKLAAVDAAIDALPSPTKEQARIAWDFSSEVHRTNGIAVMMGPLLGLTETDLDNLFKLAATL